MQSRKLNLCEGPLFKKILWYALPLICTNILQLLFSAADIAVLAIFVGDDAVAAVGANGALINLIVGLFIGLSVGANVLVARSIGKQDEQTSQRVVGSAVLIAFCLGIGLTFVGFFGARTFLVWMKCDPDILDAATTYLRIYFLGTPIMMLYNFSASILRASGDTVRPLIFLTLGGVVNVGLNILFILVFHMTVEGVAIATIASWAISAALSLSLLFRQKGYIHLEWKNLRFFPKELWEMVTIGIPSGIQSSIFALSNVLIQSSINSFGKAAMSGNTIAHQFDGFIMQATSAIALSAVTFVSQNLGAERFDRIRKTAIYCLLLSGGIGLFGGLLETVFAEPLASLMSEDPEVISYAVLRLRQMASFYFICGMMDTMSNVLRGLGKSSLAMFISIFGTCVLRVLWLNTVFQIPQFHTLSCIYLSYPISWVITLVADLICYFPTLKKLEKQTKDPVSLLKSQEKAC